MGSRKAEVVTVDFETDPIQARPVYPPKPCGVSIKHRGKKPHYYAWGHATKNNCTKGQAGEVLKDVYKSGAPLLFQNGKFDTDVAEEHFKLKVPSWEKIHDTLFLLFLHNPHARSLSLKPAAEELLGMPPEERDAVKDWLVDAGIMKKQAKDTWRHFPKAPGDVVGRYANGDTIRTEKLFDLLHPKIVEAGMQQAYDRERRLMPILLRNEREGMRVDTRGLERDLKVYERAQQDADAWLRKRLKSKELNVNSDEELADALESTGVVTEWVMTKTGKRSTAKKNMTGDMFKDQRVFAALGYRNRIETCLSTFIRPWLEMARANRGQIFTSWNQVRQSHGDESMGGTRTGRLSCSPNFQNIPKDWYDKADGYTHPSFLKLPELPLMRKYVLPDEGCVFGHRDFSQQEPRILAHFENDKLCAQYNTDPTTDVHTYGQQQIKEIVGLDLERRAVKIVVLGEIYGRGVGSTAAALGIDVETAKRLKAALHKAIPGLSALSAEVKQRGRSGQAIRTWGGRLYYVEPPAFIRGRMCTFEYKLLNYLIQGSASDCTKESIINYDTLRKEGRFLVSVHDESNFSAPKKAFKAEMLLMKEAMESVKFDVPMITDAKAGPHWGALKPWKDK